MIYQNIYFLKDILEKMSLLPDKEIEKIIQTAYTCVVDSRESNNFQLFPLVPR